MLSNINLITQKICIKQKNSKVKLEILVTDLNQPTVYQLSLTQVRYKLN